MGTQELYVKAKTSRACLEKLNGHDWGSWRMAQLFKDKNKQKLNLSVPSEYQIFTALGNNASSNQKFIED